MQPQDILTPREVEIIQQIANGFTDREIAVVYSLSDKTVSTHRKNILRKLKLRNTALLIRFAFENNLLK
jgi:DNA-binding NarL/FixJ family response regulator